jgi:hypothetical protein
MHMGGLRKVGYKKTPWHRLLVSNRHNHANYLIGKPTERKGPTSLARFGNSI